MIRLVSRVLHGRLLIQQVMQRLKQVASYCRQDICRVYRDLLQRGAYFPGIEAVSPTVPGIAEEKVDQGVACDQGRDCVGNIAERSHVYMAWPEIGSDDRAFVLDRLNKDVSACFPC